MLQPDNETVDLETIIPIGFAVTLQSCRFTDANASIPQEELF